MDHGSKDEKRFNEEVVHYLKQKIGTTNQSLVEQVASALGVVGETSNYDLFGLWKKHASEVPVASEADKGEEKFVAYLALLAKRGYFHNVEEGSAEYKDRESKARERFFAKFTATPATTPVTKAEDPHAGLNKQERERKGDEHKMKANDLLTKRQWNESIAEYTTAIEYNPDNAIYYSNRALAYQKLGKNDDAIEDAKKAIKIDASYSKSYLRLGDSYMAKKDYPAAAQAYTDGLAVDPTAQNLKAGLEKAKSYQVAPTSGVDGMGGGLGGLGDPNAMAEMMRGFMGGAGAGAGAAGAGAPGIPGFDPNSSMGQYLSSMMSNPDFMQAATNFMMENPQMMDWAQTVAQDPAMVQQILSGQMPPNIPIPDNMNEMFANGISGFTPPPRKGGE